MKKPIPSIMCERWYSFRSFYTPNWSRPIESTREWEWKCAEKLFSSHISLHICLKLLLNKKSFFFQMEGKCNNRDSVITGCNTHSNYQWTAIYVSHDTQDIWYTWKFSHSHKENFKLHFDEESFSRWNFNFDAWRKFIAQVLKFSSRCISNFHLRKTFCLR